MEFTLLANAAIAAFAGWAMLWWEGRRGNADRCAGSLWDTALIAVIVGIFVGRLVEMMINGVMPWLHPGDIVLVRAGISTMGATLAAVGTFFWVSRREPVAMADGISAAALATLSGWHGGCAVRGACLGTVSDLPWAIAQEGSAVTRHPVEIYAAMLFAAAAVGLALWKAYGRPPAGVPASLALLAAAGIRLITEPIRPSLGGGPVWFYVLGIVVGAVSAVFFWLRSRNPSPEPQTP